MFCGHPGQDTLRDVQKVADHALTEPCWDMIREYREKDPAKLEGMLSPTQENFELVRDTWEGCKIAFNRTGRARRTFEPAHSSHPLTPVGY